MLYLKVPRTPQRCGLDSALHRIISCRVYSTQPPSFASLALLPTPVLTHTGEVALQLLHLFAEVTAAVVSQTTTDPATAAAAAAGAAPSGSGGIVSPIARNNSQAVLAARRATQVAAARALGRVAAASSICRSTVIRLARDQQLLVRLLPALRCPLTIEEVEVSYFLL